MILFRLINNHKTFYNKNSADEILQLGLVKISSDGSLMLTKAGKVWHHWNMKRNSVRVCNKNEKLIEPKTLLPIDQIGQFLSSLWNEAVIWPSKQ